MAVREGLLALLANDAAYGYQLKQGFEAATGALWPLNVGQVYSTLDRLERDGLVDSLERDEQKIYRITDAGRRELAAWWELGATENPPPRDELILKVMVAAAQSIDHGLDIVTRQRSAVLASLQRRQHAARPDRGYQGPAVQPDHRQRSASVTDFFRPDP